jgi:lysozyme family protein
MPFDDALKFTLKWEGGYVNLAADPGGETYRGVSRRAHPEWDGWHTLDQMMPVHGSRYPELDGLVAAFYKKNYWDPVFGDELPDIISAVVFDHAVHSGVPRASRALQRKVGAQVDGRIGPKTVDATWAHCARLGARELVGYRQDWLTRLAERRPTLKVFSRGWQRRIDDLFKEIERGIHGS